MPVSTVRTDSSDRDANAANRGRSWVYCGTCRWSRTVRSASADSAFALAEEDARTHAALATYEGEPRRVSAVNGETGEVVVRE